MLEVIGAKPGKHCPHSGWHSCANIYGRLLQNLLSRCQPAPALPGHSLFACLVLSLITVIILSICMFPCISASCVSLVPTEIGRGCWIPSNWLQTAVSHHRGAGPLEEQQVSCTRVSPAPYVTVLRQGLKLAGLEFRLTSSF